MGTFLRVIYTKILYRIPLKFLLILLAICSVFIASVKADSVGSLLTVSSVDTSATSSSWTTFLNLSSVINTDGTLCMKIIYNGSMSYGFQLGSSNGNSQDPYNTLNIYSSVVNAGNYVCMAVGPSNYMRVKNRDSGTVNISIDYFVLNGFLGTDLPLMTSLQCQTNYNLIPISSVDQNYCTSNNLCPSSECPTCPVCPVGSGGVSTLYINDVLHIGAPFIYMNIPEEINWDYAYTQGGTNMNIDIEGYNQDADYINGLIDINNYKPTTDDLTNTFGLFGYFSGLLVVCLFVIFFFYIIKKSFK